MAAFITRAPRADEEVEAATAATVQPVETAAAEAMADSEAMAKVARSTWPPEQSRSRVSHFRATRLWEAQEAWEVLEEREVAVDVAGMQDAAALVVMG
jgi:hypothetical protein